MPLPSPQLIPRKFEGATGIVVATGPSLTSKTLQQVRDASDRHPVFIMNNLYRSIPEARVFTACDPQWWEHYGDDPVLQHHGAAKYTWSPDVAAKYNVLYIPGQWMPGLSLDPSVIHYGHSSSYQLINLAVLYGCAKLLLVGFDMKYETGKPRHYFDDLSDVPGEYPAPLRKWSKFDGLIECYKTIAQQKGLTTEIINCTPGSAMHWFPFGDLKEELNVR